MKPSFILNEKTSLDTTPDQTNLDSQVPELQSFHVLLTGSTGSLGAYLLDSLLSEPRVSKITCLNRTSDAATRQKTSHTSRGLSTDFPPSRVEFLECDLASNTSSEGNDLLGLKPSGDDHTNTNNHDVDIYKTLLQTTTHIIHNAWPVDFNRRFTTFEPQIQGVRNLIAFTRRCRLRVRLFFMSSVSVAGRWGAMPGALAQVPEVVLEDWRLAKMGYGQSKLVAERLVAEAVKQHGIDGVVCRVAQVGGPVMRGQKGEWNRGEWLPSLVISSIGMGVVPETLGPMEMVDWLPVDYVAKISLELLFDSGDGGKGDSDVGQKFKEDGSFFRLRRWPRESDAKAVSVWHVVNPRTTTWTSLLPCVLQSLPAGVKPISFVEWVNELERRNVAPQQSQGENRGLVDIPAAKLLSFFDDLRDKAIRFPRTPSATLATKKTTKHSPTMKEVQAVNPDWMRLWIKQWKLEGGINNDTLSPSKA